VLAKLERTPYAARFKEVFGENIFVERAKASMHATYAIERFEFEDPGFRPYTSKSDY
jgi:cytochrome c peroxidase